MKSGVLEDARDSAMEPAESGILPGTGPESPAMQSVRALVGRQPFIAGLSPHQVDLVAASGMEITFDAGHEIFREGSPANRFYLILEGSVVLESEQPDRSVVPIQTLGPGDDLGWSWLVPPYLLQSGARALETTRTLFFYGTRLRDQCEQDHELGYQLIKRIAGVLIHRMDATQRRLTECMMAAKLRSFPPLPTPM